MKLKRKEYKNFNFDFNDVFHIDLLKNYETRIAKERSCKTIEDAIDNWTLAFTPSNYDDIWDSAREIRRYIDINTPIELYDVEVTDILKRGICIAFIDIAYDNIEELIYNICCIRFQKLFNKKVATLSSKKTNEILQKIDIREIEEEINTITNYLISNINDNNEDESYNNFNEDEDYDFQKIINKSFERVFKKIYKN